jgi:protein-tyrosine phosphatase
MAEQRTMFRPSPPRIIELSGVSNFRDLGGWRTADGRCVREGIIYRSAALAEITTADMEKLRALGIRTVVDFRTAQECERAPTPNFGARIHNLPIASQVGASLQDILVTREATGADSRDLLGIAYDAYLRESTEQYRRFIELVMETSNRALVFHCTAGKDRTGIGAALLLTVLGVPFEAVVEDYLATNRLWRGGSTVAPMSTARHAMYCCVLIETYWSAPSTASECVTVASKPI